ncbi:unnamed protein product [Chrysodeixis includens]|uniref:Bumetanide-sensitive sodium-(Potassium)-chloride cotransporter n=1 Tax=Chrysodeixis includens TaxID=689277 RepID=A0A9P0BQU5_CHRIL|nr:unnamed protein product [Chrysodeixis includens]
MEENRFTVSSVDSESKKNGIHMGANIITRPLRSSAETVEKGVAVVAPNAQSDTWLHDAGWRRKRSLAQLTREALPRLDNYRNSKRALKRPSLGELHGDHLITEEDEKEQHTRDTKSPTPAVGIKLGWIQGVLIPCLLNIWGVMLFLRISWVVSQAGIGLSLVIIAISAFVCVITTLSMSAICTNGEVKGGGIYYIISRSLGPEFGASVGIIFAFANAVAASMNTIGFCDSLNDLLKSYDVKIIDGGLNDVRIVGAVALLVMCIICAVGMDWESKAQNFLIAIIVGAMVDFVVGTIMGPSSNQEIANGFVGLSTSTLTANFKPDFRLSEGINQDFFSVFAIFFPSVTGIQAGANISGDLKDPASAIPKGTLLALLISMVSYALMVLFSGASALRDASGNLTDLVIVNGTVVDYSGLASCVANNTCKYGLHNSYSVMQLMSAWGPFIYGGCWAATLSTALTNLLSVPRLIQALGVDRIYPGLIFFSKPYGKHGEPYRGYVLTFFVSLLFLLIADLNTIAPLISNFYLASYALINFCTFHAALVRPLGWRPTFRYYNVWLSLVGFLGCMAIMLLISWIMSLVTFAIFFTLYLIVHYRDPDVNWGSSTQAQIYKTALSSAYNLAKTGEHVKNYWPQMLVLAGRPQTRPALVDLGNLITKAGSLMIVGDISQEKLSYKERKVLSRADAEWLRARKVRAFCTRVHGFGFEGGARALLQAAGVGRLAPNVLLMGYKADWATVPHQDLLAYFNVLHSAFEGRLAVAIVRVPGGLDFGALSGAVGATGGGSLTACSSGSADELRVRRAPHIMHADSDLDIRGDPLRHNLSNILTLTTSRSFTISECSTKERKKKDKRQNDMHRQIVYNSSNGLELSKDQLSQMTIFHRKQEAGTLDVWWLYDDGGLTILLPYIISQRSNWANCKLRIFALANRLHELELEERNMANLLAKFRIDYSSLTMVQDITEPPQPETMKMFEDITKKFTDETADPECRISETELLTLAEKTKRQLRLRELLLANSKDAKLVVMSLPMPRKGSVSAPLYMAWLEVMSRDLPPMLFVRGNQTSVLTFYS